MLTVLALGGCALFTDDAVHDRENLLSAAGFHVLPANTPDRLATLARLPPNKVVQQFQGDHVSYLYADPHVCNCLYVGGQDAFGRFQGMLEQRRIASEALLASSPIYGGYGWDWGPWGGYGPGFY